MRKNIAPFITYREYQCSCCHRLPPEFYYNGGGRVDDVPYFYRELFRGFKRIREKWGRPINITSGYVCLKHQKDLYEQGIKSTLISTHNFGLALDLDCESREETESLVAVARRMCPSFRIGHLAYLYRGQTFIHIDTGYLVSPSYSKKLVEGARW
jgi:uncharacterized protein YcbK (DUF882 family)